MKTKILAFDVYGTCLPTEGNQVKRKGLDKLLERLKDQGLILCTCSDAKTKNVLKDFKEAGIDSDYFDEYFKMERKGNVFTQEPKNFIPILNHYKIKPEELTVIGDREYRDIRPAKDLGCNGILVPEYKTSRERNDFDFNTIEVH